MNQQLYSWYNEQNILQVSGSLFRYFGIDPAHGSDSTVDAYLQAHRPRCVIALLVDALGSSILQRHAEQTPFLRAHQRENVSTVYPPTTTAATTSFLTGRSPCENGWLGWNQYFHEEDDNIVLFLNRSQYGNKVYPYGTAEEKLPLDRIYDVLKRHGIPAEHAWPGWAPHNPCATFEELLQRTAELSRTNRFVYAYWDMFDTFMHEHGVSCTETGEEAAKIDEAVRAFAQSLPEDTVLLVTADHSQIDAENYPLYEDHELLSCLRVPPALEQRTVAFYLREGCHDKFIELFRKRFGDAFLLAEKQEVIRSGIFGPGVPSVRFEEFTGDLTAFALTPLELDCKPGSLPLGNHAGMLPEERYVPVILYCHTSEIL